MNTDRPTVPDLIASCWTAGGNADARGGKTPSPVDLRRRIETAGKAGWRGFGLLHADLVQARETIGYQDLHRMLDDNGIKHVELEYLLDWWTVGKRRTDSDRVRADLLAAVEPLNARHIKVGPGILGDPVEPEGMRESWAQLCEQAAAHGARVAIESAPYSYFPTVESIVSLVSDVDHPNGGLLLDIWHVYRSGMDYAVMADIVPGKSLFAVELADARAKVIGSLFEDTINNRELCGEGDADVPGFIRAIDQIGFDGPWGVEIISNTHRARPVEEALTVAYASAEHCFKIARGQD
ncbi:sugar phosphate isomerase/epimerase [Halomonas sp. ATCH28]|uniref:Sugar phosphate isomerase/epimerase n=1 Tax=Halomonas gemina TaxID=2945105 RepID=A0ABT0T1X9_9GAMM|nr:sugar phosphate isomerase/epimerase family protein [Halomonas gemina]MCL7940551.1 sugar phosphate isomerase/epimerase [Halomonas gemina]